MAVPFSVLIVDRRGVADPSATLRLCPWFLRKLVPMEPLPWGSPYAGCSEKQSCTMPEGTFQSQGRDGGNEQGEGSCAGSTARSSIDPGQRS